MPDKAAARAEADRLLAHFRAAGATPVEADILQPADTLLDLYGEDIRARAYTTADPLRGERMLRPDFTVPVVQMHMAAGASAARYTYAGEVFRRQEHDAARASEYLQVGFELFEATDPAAADAEVFARIAEALMPLPVRAATGDIGVLMAAIRSLSAPERWQAALMRHVWRPHRFRALLDRFAGRAAPPPTRRHLLDRAAAEGAEAVAETAGPEIGRRDRTEVAARIAALAKEAELPPIPAGEVALLDEILAVSGTAAEARTQLRDLARRLPAIVHSVARFETRLKALAARGIEPDTLDFVGSHGRTTMEYYDGFVFAFHAEGGEGLPPVATGGRYDALTRRLGDGRAIPAVGGVIRPGLTCMLAEGTR